MPANTSAAAGSTTRRIARFRIGYAPESGFLLRDAMSGKWPTRAVARVGIVFLEEPRRRDPAQGAERGERRREPGASRPRSRAALGALLEVPQPHHVPHLQ